MFSSMCFCFVFFRRRRKKMDSYLCLFRTPRVLLLMYQFWSCMSDHVSVEIFHSLHLERCCPHGHNGKWEFNETIIFFNQIRMNNPFEGDVELKDDKSLFILNTTLANEGTYSCVCDGLVINNYVVHVKGM